MNLTLYLSFMLYVSFLAPTVPTPPATSTVESTDNCESQCDVMPCRGHSDHGIGGSMGG